MVKTPFSLLSPFVIALLTFMMLLYYDASRCAALAKIIVIGHLETRHFFFLQTMTSIASMHAARSSFKDFDLIAISCCSA